MKTVLKYVINVGFIAVSVVICTLMIMRMKKEREENSIDPLDGFQVFLEGEEISALYLAKDSLWARRVNSPGSAGRTSILYSASST